MSAATLALWAATAVPAAAHARLVASEPAAGTTVPAPVAEIRLTFDEAVTPGAGSLVVLAGGDTVARGTTGTGAAGKVLAFALGKVLDAGAYTVAWRAVADDGHVVHGTFAFTVAAAQAAADSGDQAAADEESQGSDTGSPLAVAVRWGELMALLAMIGAVSFTLVVVRRLGSDAALRRVAERAAAGAWRLALAGAGVSVLTLAARLWLQSVSLFGADEAFTRENLDTLIRGTLWGQGWILQAVATAAFAIGLAVSRAPHGRSPGWMGAAIAALLLAAVPALSGHAAAVEGWTAIAIASDWLHVVGAGVWLGTLASVMLAGLPAAAAASDGHGTAAFARMVAAFSPVALVGAGVAGATGVVNSLFHLSAVHQLWSTPYGQTLLVKLTLLAVVAGIGFYNWRYVLPGLHATQSPGRLRRTAGLELLMGAAVVLVTAVLVGLSPP